MTAEVIPLFATPLYRSRVSVDSALQARVRQCEFLPFSSGNGLCTGDHHLLDQGAFAELRAEIQAHVHAYTRDLLSVADHIEFYMTNSWATCHQPGHHSQRHQHSNSLISGIVYIDVDQHSGQLQFFKPDNFANLWPTAVDLDSSAYNIYNSKFWSLQPVNGDIVLFPSQLNHGVTHSVSTQDRYVIAFNLFARGHIGRGSDPEITSLILR
jgi:uncharacterized protein (TIGR02466 family)